MEIRSNNRIFNGALEEGFKEALTSATGMGKAVHNRVSRLVLQVTSEWLFRLPDAAALPSEPQLSPSLPASTGFERSLASRRGGAGANCEALAEDNLNRKAAQKRLEREGTKTCLCAARTPAKGWIATSAAHALSSIQAPNHRPRRRFP